MHFVYAEGLGHLMTNGDDGDSITIAHGKCSAF
jgi:hypothetical protein